jgi:Mg-chelatase subunit ChlD
MTWAAKRQIIYFSIFMVLAIIVVGIPLFAIWYEKPTCFDNKQNGGEQGVDCGGACIRLCRAYVTAPVVVWQQSFEVSPGMYSAVAYIQNPNSNAQAMNVPYIFTFRDSANAIIGERKGVAYVPPGKNFAVFESNVHLPEGISGIRTAFAFTGDFDWMSAPASPKIEIQKQHVEGLSATPIISAEVVNPTRDDLGRINIVAIVYDTEGNAVAASRTYVDSLKKQSRAPIDFTWPRPFSGQVTSCQQPTDIILALDRSGSMSSDSTNPPEPLTSVKQAALSFINGLSSRDKIGVVSFATLASLPIDQVLSTDKASAKEAVEAIDIGTDGTQYTNIADAIQASIEELTSGRHNSTAKRALVILTDGDPTHPEKQGDPQYPADMALAAARDAQSRDIEVFTIGLGKNINDDFLKSVAGLDERYFRAPSADDLQSVYSQIGAAICKLGPAKVEIIPDVLPQ